MTRKKRMKKAAKKILGKSGMKSHTAAGKPTGPATRSADAPQCWRDAEKNIVLFTDRTRDGRFAVYYVGNLHAPARGQRKTRYTKIEPGPLSGGMQFELDEYAEKHGFEKCRKAVHASIRQALKTGERQ